MRPLLAIALLPWAAALGPPASVAQELTSIPLAHLMTPVELQATGVASLTLAQGAALALWLADYTRQITDGGGVAWDRGPLGHRRWVRENRMHGGVLVLDDGSEWEIRRADAGATALWAPGMRVLVLEGGVPDRPYNYLLVNRDNSERALANRVGGSAARSASGEVSRRPWDRIVRR